MLLCLVGYVYLRIRFGIANDCQTFGGLFLTGWAESNRMI